jgi:hypothetical protein
LAIGPNRVWPRVPLHFASLGQSQPSCRAGQLERVIGSFKDEPAFEEVLEYGRALRQADRPAEDDGP